MYTHQSRSLLLKLMYQCVSVWYPPAQLYWWQYLYLITSRYASSAVSAHSSNQLNSLYPGWSIPTSKHILVKKRLSRPCRLQTHTIKTNLKICLKMMRWIPQEVYRTPTVVRFWWTWLSYLYWPNTHSPGTAPLQTSPLAPHTLIQICDIFVICYLALKYKIYNSCILIKRK